MYDEEQNTLGKAEEHVCGSINPAIKINTGEEKNLHVFVVLVGKILNSEVEKRDEKKRENMPDRDRTRSGNDYLKNCKDDVDDI